MPSRGGRFLFPPGVPASSQAEGIWSLYDMSAAMASSSWPANFITFNSPPGYVDATGDGSATINFYPSMSSGTFSYYWERSTDDGGTWGIVTGETGSSLTIAGQVAANDGDLYRMTVASGIRSKTSPSVLVRVDDSMTFNVYSQPVDYTAAEGSYGYFYVGVYATGAKYGANYYTMAFQWQKSTDSGATWSDIIGENNYYIYYYSTSSATNGWKFRLAITAGGVTHYSSPATLTSS